MWKEPGQDERGKPSPVQEKRTDRLPCWFPKLLRDLDPVIWAKEPWTGGPIFWRRWEYSQHFRENTGVQTDRSWSQLTFTLVDHSLFPGLFRLSSSIHNQ
ncbi:hypothetical protein D4764_22G0003710 [Takifugu flavidus]|uniref:Uncharacterized protein n=1 Tax=Takifugu flavidus TaxID=433684 RepID=A0A5C6NBC0_9TELE|nr:hypothetical protein D4764_22G0003710 [Takifugu flavidus]